MSLLIALAMAFMCVLCAAQLALSVELSDACGAPNDAIFDVIVASQTAQTAQNSSFEIRSAAYYLHCEDHNPLSNLFTTHLDLCKPFVSTYH